MKCELCHKADAEVAIRRTVNGEEQELYVCRGCEAASLPHAADAVGSLSRQPPATPQPSDPLGPTLRPLVGLLIDAAFEIAGGSVNLQEPKCPVCGITRSEYRKSSRLGCPACYESFAKELNAAVLEMHRSLQHVGKTPERAKTACQRQKLLDALDAAVKDQRYEEAIRLRDELRKLGDDKGGPAAC
jgi:protein arginine kinase activator